MLLAAASLAESTRRIYRIYLLDFVSWCGTVGRNHFPATRQTMEAYAAKLARQGRSVATINVALAAVRTAHVKMGDNRPDLTLAREVIEGYARTEAPIPRTTVPIMLPTLSKMVEVCAYKQDGSGECDFAIRTARDQAMLQLGMGMMARRSELVGLDIGHIKIESDGIDIFVARSKTDQRRHGRWTFVPYNEHLPAADTVQRYIKLLAELGISDPDTPLFRAIDQWGSVNGAPEQWVNGIPRRWGGAGIGGNARMDGASLEIIIAKRSLQARINNSHELRPHGLRAGGATETWLAGADILSIARQGRWGERSPVVFGYIKDADRRRRNPVAALGT